MNEQFVSHEEPITEEDMINAIKLWRSRLSQSQSLYGGVLVERLIPSLEGTSYNPPVICELVDAKAEEIRSEEAERMSDYFADDRSASLKKVDVGIAVRGLKQALIPPLIAEQAGVFDAIYGGLVEDRLYWEDYHHSLSRTEIIARITEEYTTRWYPNNPIVAKGKRT